jgi:hypothetical protein
MVMVGEMLSITGGARIGWRNATWPLAKLIVQPDRIDINIKFLGNYSFTKEQVISLKKYSIIPVIGQGIKIAHTISEYPKKIIFWTFDNPESIIIQIKETGFSPEAESFIFP